jgi:AraC family transcriptional regulator
MDLVQQPGVPAALRKIFCGLTGMTCTFETEGTWANGLLYAAIWHYAGSDPEMKFGRPEHGLSMTLGGASDLTRIKVSGSSLYEGRHRVGCVTFTPADIEGQSWHRNYSLDRLHLLIDPSFLRSFEFGMDPLDLPYRPDARDQLLANILWALADEMRDGVMGLPSIYVEHAAGLLMAHLTHTLRRRYSGHPFRAGLPEASLRGVIEFIEENLGQDISLAALAALAGTGVDVFARNFKASMGLPPYRYVLERRLRRAQALLAENGKSIAEIAFEVGFSSQAHFTAQFSKAMAMSPASYRALLRQ